MMKKYEIFILSLWATLLLRCSSSSSESSGSKSSSFECSPHESEENGYIFTCPRSLKTGARNELYLRRFGCMDAGVLEITVFYQDPSTSNESIAIEESYDIEDGVKDVVLPLNLKPFDGYVYRGRIVMNGTFGDYTIGGSNEVYFRSSKDYIVLIQTDKPFYKEGQIVFFRVLILDNSLKPYKNAKADIWVEDPKNTRLFQWKNECLQKGMKQYEFPLADEPLKGNWKISVSLKEDITSTNFEVKEYVLPKFEVSIQPPPYVLTTAEEILITVCAKYTYGKPVKGDLHMNISLETYYYYRSTEKIPVQEYEGEIDGCLEYTLNVSLIETENNQFYRRIQIIVGVEEAGTGVQINATQSIQRLSSPLNLNFNRDQVRYYKPGLPFNGKLTVRNPDNTPAKDEDVQICYTASRERVLCNWSANRKDKFCRNYTSDEEGFIKYIIPQQYTDSTYINVNAISLKYVKKTNGTEREKSLDAPQTSMSLKPWYSPSGSFIQLQPVQKSLSCGTRAHFKLLFTSKENANYKFYYQVLSQGYVVKSGYIDEWFSTDDDVSTKFEDEDELVNDKEIQLVPPVNSSERPTGDEECPAIREAKYIPPIGEASIVLKIDPSWSPLFRLLVFYVRDDRETVADSQKFKVAQCFKNKVKLQFGDAVKQPATKTTLRVSASPNSLCGIKVIDKSVSLLNSNDQLTKERVSQILESLDNGMYYEVNHCNDDIPQPGLSKTTSSRIILPPRPPQSSSNYEDSLAAFETSGLLVISDLVIFTRPCSSRGNGNNVVYYSSKSRAGGGSSMAHRKSNFRSADAQIDSANDEMGGAAAATKSNVELRNYFPDTWLFKLEMTGEDGVLMTKEKLPHTITEWVGNAVCLSAEDGLGISNKTSIRGFQAFFLSMTLPYSVIRGEEFFIIVSLFNYVDEALPITISVDEVEGFEVISESIDGDICIQSETSETLKIKLRATSLGQPNITIRAETAQSSDVCEDSSVSSAFAKDAIQQSIIVEAEGFPVEEAVSTLFCPSEEGNGMFHKKFSLSVPDENYVEDSGRGFFLISGNILGIGLDNVDNLVTLPTGCGEQNMAKFAPNVVAFEVLEDSNQLTDKLNSRITRNLITGYQRQLKYRHSDGSFSAFGDRDKEGSMFLTAFVLRYFSRATKYVTIDNSTLVQMQNWILSKQQSDGCFPNSGKIFDVGLQGGIENQRTEGPITAYVLASLITSKCQNQTALDSAFSCINESEDDSLYATFLYAYAESLADKQDSANQRISEAKKRAITKRNVEYYRDVNATKSQELETTAYAALCILVSDGSASDALPIIQFLTQNLNSRGGFSSTQDTCVGFEALAYFARLTIKDPVDIHIEVTGGLSKEISVSEEDKLLVKKYKITDVPSELDVTAEGTGCALIQSVLRYNTNTPPEKRNFKIQVESVCLDDKGERGSISITTSYIPENQKTGMALVEVKMVSGIVPVKESLEKLLADASLQLMKYDVENNVVIFYFSQITNENKRFSFEVEIVVRVDNSQPGTVKVYDYYNRDISGSANYSFKDCMSNVT